jgi:hypothetical protein
MLKQEDKDTEGIHRIGKWLSHLWLQTKLEEENKNNDET